MSQQVSGSLETWLTTLGALPKLGSQQIVGAFVGPRDVASGVLDVLSVKPNYGLCLGIISGLQQGSCCGRGILHHPVYPRHTPYYPCRN